MRRTLSWLTLLAVALAAAPTLRGQQPPARPDSPPPEEYRVRVEVELVTAPLVAHDSRGEFVYNLRRDEITLLDNGIPQQLRAFELASQPISLVMLFDTARRVASLLDRVRPSGILFTSYVLGQFGEAAVITFDTEITLRQEFTSDPDKIIDAVKAIRPGGSQTRLADALDQAVTLLRGRPEGRRRVIVAVTEPRDNGSHTPIGVPLRLAQLFDISVYTIALSRTQAELLRRPEDTPVARSPYPPGVFPTPGIPGSVQTPTSQAQQRYARADLLSAVVTLVSTLRNIPARQVLEV
ncbi:MAG: VWA domain-containing protein, partial [Terriglobia bacterium]